MGKITTQTKCNTVGSVLLLHLTMSTIATNTTSTTQTCAIIAKSTTISLLNARRSLDSPLRSLIATATEMEKTKWAPHQY